MLHNGTKAGYLGVDVTEMLKKEVKQIRVKQHLPKRFNMSRLKHNWGGGCKGVTSPTGPWYNLEPKWV